MLTVSLLDPMSLTLAVAISELVYDLRSCRETPALRNHAALDDASLALARASAELQHALHSSGPRQDHFLEEAQELIESARRALAEARQAIEFAQAGRREVRAAAERVRARVARRAEVEPIELVHTCSGCGGVTRVRYRALGGPLVQRTVICPWPGCATALRCAWPMEAVDVAIERG